MPDSTIGLSPHIYLYYNGGKSRTTGEETEERNVAYGESFTCPAPVSRGDQYSYEGWARNSRKNSPSKPCTFTATDAEYKMYCIWSHYDITLNYNGGHKSGDSSVTVDSTTFKHSARGTALSLPTPASRSGFSYQGWSESRSPSTQEDIYNNSDNKYKPYYNKTLYCVWFEQHYDVTLKLAGGTYNGSTANISLVKLGGSALSLPQPTRTGYNFLGWATENTPSGSVAFGPNEDYTYNAAHTLTAVWQIKTYTVSYNLNGGSGSFANQTKTYGTNLKLRTGEPTRSGYIFQGWSSNASSTVAYKPGDTYTENKALTLTAVWLATYQITYNLNGGSGSFAAQTKKHGTAIKLHSEKPVRKGYQFMGWSSNASSTVAYAAGATYSENKALSLTAVWKHVACALNEVADTIIGQCPVFSWTPDIATDSYSLALSFKSWSYTITDIYPNTTTTYTYDIYALPMELCRLMGDVTSGTMTATLTTYDSVGASAGTSTVSFNIMVPESEGPDFTYVLYDQNPNDIGLYITNQSIIEAKITAIPADGTTAMTARLIIDGEAVSGTFDQDNSVTLSTGKTIINEAVKTVTIEVTDSRGRSTTKSTNINIWDYKNPTVAMSLEEDDGDVTITIKGYVSPLNGNNSPTVTLVRSDDGTGCVVGTAKVGTAVLGSWSGETAIEISPQPSTTTFTLTVTDDISELTASTVRYIATVTDTWGNSATVNLSLWLGERITESDINEDTYYVGFDDDITSDTQPNVTIEDGTLTVDVSPCELGEECLVGFPIKLKKEHRYQLTYQSNKLTDTVVKVSYFALDGELTLIDTEPLGSGSVLTIPTHEYDNEEEVWAVIYFGMNYVDENDFIRTFWDISLRELFPTSIEEIPWHLETDTLGLDTPNHKYISKVQLRVAFDGVVSVSIAYDNGDFMRVFSGRHEKLRSFTIPINVRRCDHFRLRMEGIGQLKLFSMGYSLAEGSQWNA